jgi:oligopeptide transport system substrate-binding protein
VSKRWFWLGLMTSIVLSLGLIAAGCGDDDDDDDDDDVEPTEAETEAADDDDETPEATEEAPTGELPYERQEGGDVTLHFLEPQGLDPHVSSFAVDISLQRMLWRGLYSLDAENNVVADVNGIATGEPEVSEDGLTYTITLNEGLTWSDGDDLTAEDYVAGVLRTCNPVNAGEYSYVLTDLTPVAGCTEFYTALTDADGNAIDPATVDLAALQSGVGVRAVDATTIEYTLTRPAPTFGIILSLWMTFPVPTHIERFGWDTAAGGFADPALSPQGHEQWFEGQSPDSLAYNGPYILTGYTQGDSAVVAPNPNWSGLIKPTLEQITLRFIDDTAVANNAYRTGELLFSQADTSQLQALEAEFGPTGEYLLVVVPTTRGLEIQMENETLSNLEVRLALAQAIDRETLNTVVGQGGNIPTTSWIPEEISGVPIGTYDEVQGFDPESAQAHLEAAGYPGGAGFPTDLTILVGESPTGRATAEFLQQQFQEILGISVQVEAVDNPTRSTRFTTEEFTLFPGGWIQDYPDPENWIVGLFDTDGGNNHYNCSLPEIDSLVADAISNTNDEERRQQYRDIEALILENVCGMAPYWHETNKYLIKPELVGFHENAKGQDGFIAGDWFAEAWGLAAE